MHAVVILAAGYGTRMKSQIPKVMHTLSGRPLVEWSIQIAEYVADSPPVVVVGHGKDLVMSHLNDRALYAVQEQLLGTGHAVQQAEEHLRGKADSVLVIYGDMPLLRGETLAQLTELFQTEKQQGDLALAMLTVTREDPQGFGRIIRDEDQNIQAIVEEVDCTPEQRKITELNPGVYCFDADWLWENLRQVPLSAKGEYYLTDLVSIAVEQGLRIASMAVEPMEVHGINTRVHLAEAEQLMRRRILERHMLSGVTIMDPSSTYVDDTVEIGVDTTILPGTFLIGSTKIGKDCVIGPNSQIEDSTIGDHCSVKYSVLEEAVMGDLCEIGPFGHLRKGAQLDTGVHLGNFGEIKNSYIGPGTKMGHFSYIGDASIGANVNIGAGTITCNYDGEQKHKTEIGEGAFIGSDTMLVAPISLGPGAMTGAGSVVTKDVPADTRVYGVPAKPSPQPRQSITNKE